MLIQCTNVGKRCQPSNRVPIRGTRDLQKYLTPYQTCRNRSFSRIYTAPQGLNLCTLPGDFRLLEKTSQHFSFLDKLGKIYEKTGPQISLKCHGNFLIIATLKQSFRHERTHALKRLQSLELSSLRNTHTHTHTHTTIHTHTNSRRSYPLNTYGKDCKES